MSFGFSPSDIKLLVEITSRVFIAFNGKTDSSTAQVGALIQEFTTLARCLLQLEELLKEYGKPLPFPIDEFWNTLEICEKKLEPYRENLVDNKTGMKRIYWTLRYIGLEGEMAGLKERVTGHIQALNMCMQFLSLRLQFEQSQQQQRLLLPPPFRTLSLGGQMYSNNVLSSAMQEGLQALPAPGEEYSLFKDWDIYNRWLKNEEERISQEVAILRPLSYGDTPPVQSSPGVDAAKVLSQLRQKANEAITIKENRTKRAFVSPNEEVRPEISESMKQEIKGMPPAPYCKYTPDTAYSGNTSRFGNYLDISQSVSTLEPLHQSLSPSVSPKGSPEIPAAEFTSIDWSAASPSPVASSDLGRGGSMSTTRSSLSTSSGFRLSPLITGSETTCTTPDGLVQQRFRSPSLRTMGIDTLGQAALQWTKLCRKVQVERSLISSDRGGDKIIVETKECDVQWCNQEDGAVSIRALYRSSKDNRPKVWTLQTFAATGPSIPLTTTIAGKTVIDFPRRSFGKLDKRYTDIKYVFPGSQPGTDGPNAATDFQTLLYGNGGKDDVRLLYDRPIVTISSDKQHPECRGKNIRLWVRSERHLVDEGLRDTKVLRILFYASSLEERGHWVEEPHLAFKALGATVLVRPRQEIRLSFVNNAKKWTPDQLFQRRSSSLADAIDQDNTRQPGKRKENLTVAQMPWIAATSPGASSAFSINSSPSIFRNSPGIVGPLGLNRFGYSWLEVKFCNERDQSDFVKIWKDFAV